MRLLFCIVSFSLLIGSAKAQSIEEARKWYADAMNDKSVCETAYKKMATLSSGANTLLRGYKGAIAVAMSKHLKTAKEKIACFNEGKMLIEGAIAEDAKNVELKFIRFTIQSNCPAALKYNKNITEDSKFIIDNLASVKNTTIREKIKSYLLQSKNITSIEKERINAL